MMAFLNYFGFGPKLILLGVVILFFTYFYDKSLPLFYDYLEIYHPDTEANSIQMAVAFALALLNVFAGFAGFIVLFMGVLFALYDLIRSLIHKWI